MLSRDLIERGEFVALDVGHRSWITIQNLHPARRAPRISATSMQDVDPSVHDGQYQSLTIGGAGSSDPFHLNDCHESLPSPIPNSSADPAHRDPTSRLIAFNARSIQSGVVPGTAHEPLPESLREFRRMRPRQHHRPTMAIPGRSSDEGIDDSAFDKLALAVKHLDADPGKDVERDLIRRHQICNWPVDPELNSDVVFVDFRFADHVGVVDIGEQPLGLDRESDVRIGIFRPPLPEAGTQGLHDVVDHTVASPPQSSRGEPPPNCPYTSFGAGSCPNRRRAWVRDRHARAGQAL